MYLDSQGLASVFSRIFLWGGFHLLYNPGSGMRHFVTKSTDQMQQS